MKTIQEMLQELSQCIVTVSGEFRFRTNWNGGGKVPQPDLDTFDPNVPFCIENVGDVQANIQYNTKNTNIRISKDYKTWNDYTSGTEIELNPKDRVYIKSDYVLDESTTPKFNFTNANGTRLRARGNIASLIYGTNDAYVNKYTSTERYCYRNMFSGCTSLVQAPELPATKLTEYCYSGMFEQCNSLVQAPELPATTLARECYSYMLWYCASLTQVPELPATTLARECYKYMFGYCKSLTQVPDLPAMILADNCCEGMFSSCTSLAQAPVLPATTLADYCYYSMFSGCTSLTAITINDGIEFIGNRAFEGCFNLKNITILATTPPELVYTFDTNPSKKEGPFDGTSCPIYVPAQSVDTYKSAWTDYADRITSL